MSNSLQIGFPPMEVEPVNRERLNAVDDVNRERDWLNRFVVARMKAGVSQKDAAFALGGISVQLLSAQEHGAENRHLSFRRMWNLGPEFWTEMIEQICDFHGIAPGMSVQDEEDRRLGKAYRELQQQALRSVSR